MVETICPKKAQSLCRTCMGEDGPMHCLFTEFIESNDCEIAFSDVLMNCAAVQVNKDDGLSDIICENCVQQLLTAFNFRKQCEQVDVALRDLTEMRVKEENVEMKEEIVVLKETSMYSCLICGSIFDTDLEAKQHRNLHRRYKCKLCPRVFKSSHGLDYHLKVHNGIKKYVCSYENCNKRFALKQALEKHTSVHSNEKNHLCVLCGKRYGTYDSLKYHMKHHNGERPHLCVHCGKTFLQACHLKAHMWIHNGIKPHSCNSCGKSYTSGHQLKKHLRKYCNREADERNEIINK